MNIITIAQRELKSYFFSPIAYVVAAAFLVITGYFFSMILFYTQQATLRYLFNNMSVILLLIAPVLSMKLLADEQRLGTIELLLTAPVRDYEVVLGKFLACVGFLAALLGLTLYYPLILTFFGSPDWGPIITGYLGMLLFGAALLSVGLFASALTQNQIVAAVLSFVFLLFMWMVASAGDFLGGGPVSSIIQYIGLEGHFEEFTKGVIALKDAVFYLSFSAVFLFLTVRVLESRRWK